MDCIIINLPLVSPSKYCPQIVTRCNTRVTSHLSYKIFIGYPLRIESSSRSLCMSIAHIKRHFITIFLRRTPTPYFQPPVYMRSNNKHLLRKPLAITSWGERSITSAAPSLWNDLPDHVKLSPSFVHNFPQASSNEDFITFSRLLCHCAMSIFRWIPAHYTCPLLLLLLTK